VIDLTQFRVDPAEEAILAATFADGAEAVVSRREFRVMGSTASISAVGGRDGLVDDAVGLAHELEGLWTRFSRESDISQLNWAEGNPVEVDPRTIQLIEAMRVAHRETEGAFDPTLLPALLREGYTHSLVDSSRFTALPESARSPGLIEGIVVDGNSVTLPKGTTLDSGGIGKGFAADVIAGFIRESGALGAMVELGGDVRVDGYSPRGRGWRLAVDHPLESDARMSTIEIEAGGVATSSQLKRRFNRADGSPSHHLIDSVAGHSVESSSLAVTVIAPTAWQAEVAAKVGFTRAPADFLAYARRRSLKAGVYTSDNQWIRSSDWPEYRA
jgi:thiamine biosynthesis lipoprotein